MFYRQRLDVSYLKYIIKKCHIIHKNNKYVSVTPNQIERLYSRFTSLDRSDCGTLSRDDFLRIPELAINPLCDRIVHAFFTHDDRVNFRQFMKVLAHFRPIKKTKTNKLNNRDEKLKCKYIFKLIYLRWSMDSRLVLLSDKILIFKYFFFYFIVFFN